MLFRRSLKCSFCKRPDSQVAKLVAGPRVYICDRCVTIAAEIMGEYSGGDSPTPEPTASIARRVLRRFGFGGRNGEARRQLAPPMPRSARQPV